MNDELLREVDQALQQERWQTLWQQYGKWIGYGCVAIVILSAVIVFWREQQIDAREHETSLLLQARSHMASQRHGEAKKALDELVADASGDMRAIGYLWMAKLQLAVDQKADAIESLATIVPNRAEATTFSMLGCLKGYMLAPQDPRFHPCLGYESALESLGAELQAIDLTLKGDTVKALELLPDTTLLPQTQKHRVTDLHAYLSSSVEKPAEAKTDETPAQ